jgi:O-antigen ligase
MIRVRSLPDHAERLARWCAIALGFSIPISVVLDNALIALLFVAWIAGGRYREKLAVIRGNPVAVIACLFFLAYAASAIYSVGGRSDVLHALDKATIYLLIPVLISASLDQKARDLALHAFMTAVLVILVLSFLVWFGVISEGRFVKGTPTDAVVFKLHITHSLLMTFGACLFALKARGAAPGRHKLIYLAIAALAAFNVLFMVEGRTGQLVLFALLFYLLFEWLHWRGILVAAIASVVIGGAAYLSPSSTFHQRLTKTLREVEEWRPGQSSTTSIGQRLEFYRNSVAIVRENPLFGVGTGGFPAAYAKKVEGTSMVATRNPHNEYLMVTIQLGVVGLALLLYLFWSQWRFAPELVTPFDQTVARALVITIAIASMVSSTLIDHTEGLFYAWASGVLFSGLTRRTG